MIMAGFNKDNLPLHIGFIMDGNGRWAKKRGLPRTYGHKEGAQAFRKIVKHCKEIGIRYITFYAFSTENWSRPKDEVSALMTLFNEYLDEADELTEKSTRLVFLGDKSKFSSEMQKKMINIEEKSKNYSEMTVSLAMNYGGRDDIVHSVKKIVQMVQEGCICIDEIDERLISRHLYTGDIPDVDLVIRPSGEKRISNFLIWQSSYAELYFTDVLWPDFSAKELNKALEEFSSRSRRFGGV